MSELFSLEELSSRINAWCDEHEIAPASGQAGESVSERSIRYYRTLGLIDPPAAGGYGEKHLLQLTAIRLLQAQGVPLRRIRELLYGRSVRELEQIRRRGLAQLPSANPMNRVAVPASGELWRVIPLNDEFLLMSRRGTPITPQQRDAVLEALQPKPTKQRTP